MSRLLLVRHGQSEWNAAGRMQGHADPSLTDLGRQQSQAAARALGSVEAIVSSSLARALETAAVIAEELGVGPVIVDEALRERHVGEWQGLTRGDIHRTWPGYLRDDPAHGEGRPASDRHPPAWESDEAIIDRTLPALVRAALLAHEGDAVVVTHGGIIGTWERHLGCPREGPMFNLSGRWFAVSPGATPVVTGGERVVLVDRAALTAPPRP